MFSELDAEQKEALMLAFNECRDHIVILESGKFVGCNIENTGDLVIYQQSDNGWICGEIKDE